MIRVPKRSKRRGHYVSPSTLSLSLAVAAAAGCTGCSAAIAQTMNLQPGSPGCVDAAAGTTCTLSLVLNPGTYTGTIVTYDGALDGSNKPTGKILSSDQSFPMTVASGKANVPTITLSGVPTGLQFFSLSPIARIVTNSPVFLPVGGTVPLNALLVAGQNTSVRLSAYATDPDGNVILGPGAPAFAITVGGGFSATVEGSSVRLTTPAVANTTAVPMTVVANSPACVSVAACTWSMYAGFDTLLAVADPGNNNVSIQTAGSNPSNPVVATITNGISDPVDVKFDASGNLFVANNSGNTVTEYAPPYTGAPIVTISNGVSSPTALALSSGGQLAVANATQLTLYSPPYGGNPGTVSVAALSEIFDTSGNLWLGTATHVLEYKSPSFSAPNVTVSLGINSPTGLAFDETGALYVANHGNSTIEKFASGSYSSTAATASMAGVTSLAILASSFIVACGTGAANLYGSSLGAASIVDSAGSTPCQPAFDRIYGVWLTLPNSSTLLDYPYPPGISGYVQQSGGLKQPVAIAAYPPATAP